MLRNKSFQYFNLSSNEDNFITEKPSSCKLRNDNVVDIWWKSLMTAKSLDA